MRFGTERDREENRSVSGRITLFVFPGGKHMRGHFSERKSEWKPSFLMPMSLSTLRASAPLCHLDTCGNVLFACLLHQILSASGAGAESVSVLPPGAAMVPVSEKGKCLYRECLRCTSAFSPWEEGRSQQGRVSVPTTAGGRSGSGPPLGLCPGCSLCLDDCLPPPGPFLNVTCSKHPSLTL